MQKYMVISTTVWGYVSTGIQVAAGWELYM